MAPPPDNNNPFGYAASGAGLFGGGGGAGGGAGVASAPDPYNFKSTVNLSGKIGAGGVGAAAGDYGAGAGGGAQTAGASLLSSVANVVETGYQSARTVVFGADPAAGAGASNGQQAAGGSAQAGAGPSFSFFSLSYQQIINFVIAILAGALFMFMAFLFLPMVVIAPQKFTLLFTLGCVCWIVGLATLQGVSTLMAACVQKERLPFSLCYGVSLIGTFYATILAHSYLLTLLFASAQLISLFAFVVSYFPGGIKMLSMVKDIVVDQAKTRLGISGGSSLLPI